MQSDELDDGTVIRIPSEHDPSPIKRALGQKQDTRHGQGNKARTNEDELKTNHLIAGLLEGM